MIFLSSSSFSSGVTTEIFIYNILLDRENSAADVLSPLTDFNWNAMVLIWTLLFLGTGILVSFAFFKFGEKFKKRKLLIFSDLISFSLSLIYVCTQNSYYNDQNSIYTYPFVNFTFIFVVSTVLNLIILPFYLKEMFRIQKCHFFLNFFFMLGLSVTMFKTNVMYSSIQLFYTIMTISFLHFMLLLTHKDLKYGTPIELLKSNKTQFAGKIIKIFGNFANVNEEIDRLKQKLRYCEETQKFTKFWQLERKNFGIAFLGLLSLCFENIFPLLLFARIFQNYDFFTIGTDSLFYDNYCMWCWILFFIGYCFSVILSKFVNHKLILIICGMATAVFYLVFAFAFLGISFNLITRILFLGQCFLLGLVCEMSWSLIINYLSFKGFIILMGLFWSLNILLLLFFAILIFWGHFGFFVLLFNGIFLLILNMAYVCLLKRSRKLF